MELSVNRKRLFRKCCWAWSASLGIIIWTFSLVGCGGSGAVNVTESLRDLVPPKLLSITPSSGPTTGRTTVTITGTGIQTGATVLFGTVAARINSVTSTSIEAVTPAHDPGKVDVKLTNPDTGSDTLPTAFTFEGTPPPVTGPAPTISTIVPNSGPMTGGTDVTITGTNFQNGATVTFGGNPAPPVIFLGSTQLKATTPASTTSGAVDVTVTNPDGAQSMPFRGGFTYVLPHYVELTWNPSPSVAPGYYIWYNIYRRTKDTSYDRAKPLNSTLIDGTTYRDYDVQAGQEYFYVATAVDANNVESVFSNEAQAVIPTP